MATRAAKARTLGKSDERKQAPDSEGAITMKSLRTSLRILNVFAGDEKKDFGVGEVAQACDLAKSHVSKVLYAFAEFGYLVQDPETRRYAVGVRTFALGSRFVTHDRLCRAAMPVMRDLVNTSGHSVRFSVLDGDRVLYLLGLEGPMFFDSGWRSGTWLPVHSTTAGRVLMAFMESDTVTRLLSDKPLRAVTPHTVTTEAAVRRLVAQVVRKGYASQRNETTLGLGTIAVPIFDAHLHAVGSLGLAFPSHIVPVSQEPALAAMLHDAARTLSQRMGCHVYPYGGVESALVKRAGSTALSPLAMPRKTKSTQTLPN